MTIYGQKPFCFSSKHNFFFQISNSIVTEIEMSVRVQLYLHWVYNFRHVLESLGDKSYWKPFNIKKDHDFVWHIKIAIGRQMLFEAQYETQAKNTKKNDV